MVKHHIYEIRIEGHLGESWSPWLGGLEIRHLECGDTILSGPLADEPALHGVLTRVSDLGLRLIALRRIAAGDPPDESEGRMDE